MSYKLRDKLIKSDWMPAQLQRVLDAYLSFANKDGTSIRPTQRNVAKRAKLSLSTVSRHTKELVRLGLLVHDKNEHGDNLTYAYSKQGVWAYIYHADLSRLDSAEVKKEFGRKRLEISQVRSAANSKMRQTTLRQFAAKCVKDGAANCSKPFTSNCSKDGKAFCSTDPTQVIDPRYANPKDDPSATSVAVEVSKQVSKVTSFAPLTTCSSAGGEEKQIETRELVKVASTARNFRGDMNHYAFGRDGEFIPATLIYPDWDTANTPLAKPLVPDHVRKAMQWAWEQSEHPVDTPSPDMWSERLQRKLDQEEWDDLDTYYRELFQLHLTDPIPDTELVTLAEVMIDLQRRYPPCDDDGYEEGTHPIRGFVAWNKRHKTGGMVFACGTDIAKTYWSDSPKSGVRQWESHDDQVCRVCRVKAKAEAREIGY